MRQPARSGWAVGPVLEQPFYPSNSPSVAITIFCLNDQTVLINVRGRYHAPRLGFRKICFYVFLSGRLQDHLICQLA